MARNRIDNALTTVSGGVIISLAREHPCALICVHAQMEVVNATAETSFLRITPSTAVKSAHVAPGGKASVGRFKDRCTLAVADRWLAPLHFEICSEGPEYVVRDLSSLLSQHPSCERRCFVEELRSSKCAPQLCAALDVRGRTGLHLNGRRVEQATLQNADVLVAGRTSFQVVIQAQPFAAVSERPDPRAPGLTQAQRVRLMTSLDHRGVYALLDAARGPDARALRLQHPELSYSLYDGPDVERFVDVAPYLVQLEKGSLLLDTWLTEHWGQAFGYFVVSDAPFKLLRRHFRKFLKVESAQGRRMLFRFYDPRVIRGFLPTCARAELVDFFGPISQLIVESHEPFMALRYSVGERGLRSDLLHLDATLRAAERRA